MQPYTILFLASCALCKNQYLWVHVCLLSYVTCVEAYVDDKTLQILFLTNRTGARLIMFLGLLGFPYWWICWSIQQHDIFKLLVLPQPKYSIYNAPGHTDKDVLGQHVGTEADISALAASHSGREPDTWNMNVNARWRWPRPAPPTCHSSWSRPASSLSSPAWWSLRSWARRRNSAVACPSPPRSAQSRSGWSSPYASYHCSTHTPGSPLRPDCTLRWTEGLSQHTS